jgi:hypothetical protein
MRTLMIAALIAAAVMTASTAQAQTGMSRIPYYPWCAVTGEHFEGGEGRSCGFVSYEQCMDSVRGQTGMCFENIWGASRPSAAPAEKKQPRKRKPQS